MQGATLRSFSKTTQPIPFQSTPPMQGATFCIIGIHCLRHSFNPRPLCRERRVCTGIISCTRGFNPRPLCRERLILAFFITPLWVFQSTPPMQGATNYNTTVDKLVLVSIHAPYAGSDLCLYFRHFPKLPFQSTPPMQGATQPNKMLLQIFLFQSTPPMQGATRSDKGDRVSLPSFNPRPLCRERRDTQNMSIKQQNVSIHAPYAGSDGGNMRDSVLFYRFNPRPLCRERPGSTPGAPLHISFNPRPLCRERRPLFVATSQRKGVSIHAPYAGSDNS